jgi:hypothetical protein
VGGRFTDVSLNHHIHLHIINSNYINSTLKNRQWPKEIGQKDKQRSTKHIHKTKDRAIQTPLKTFFHKIFFYCVV